MEKFKLDLKFDEERVGQVLVYHINEALDEVVSHTLFDIIRDKIESGERRIILNFANVDFICTEALGLLLSLSKLAREHKSHFVLSSIPGPIWDILQDTGLLEFFTTRDTVEEALSFLSKS